MNIHLPNKNNYPHTMSTYLLLPLAGLSKTMFKGLYNVYVDPVELQLHVFCKVENSKYDNYVRKYNHIIDNTTYICYIYSIRQKNHKYALKLLSGEGSKIPLAIRDYIAQNSGLTYKKYTKNGYISDYIVYCLIDNKEYLTIIYAKFFLPMYDTIEEAENEFYNSELIPYIEGDEYISNIL